MKKNREKNDETKKVFSNLADSLGKSKKDILGLLECHGAKSEEKLLCQTEGFLEEEVQKGKLSQELKNEILDLLKKGVNGKTGTIIDIKDKDSIKKVMEEKGLDFDKLWDSYIEYLHQKIAIKENEEAEGFLEEEIQKGKLSQELKNEILDLLKKGVNGKTGTIIDIKDSIRKVMEKKGLNFDEFWDSYIKHLRQKLAINKNEEFDELWNSYIKYLRQKQAINKNGEAEGLLEEEKQKKIEEELKNEILDLLEKGVNGKTGPIIDIKDSIRKAMEKKGLNFDEFWDLYIKYLYNKWLVIIRNEEKVKKSILKLKEIEEGHTEFNGMSEGVQKEKEWKEISLLAGVFGAFLSAASILIYLLSFSKLKTPISRKMFRKAIRSNVKIALFDEELKEKVDDLLNLDSESVDSKYKSLVDEVREKIKGEIGKSKPNNGLVYFEKKFGGFIYREIDNDSDKIYCRIPIKSFGNKDLQYSIGKVDAYIVYEKGQDGVWKGFLIMDDYYDFPEGNFKSIKGILNKIGNSLQKKDKITTYHWRISYDLPPITEEGIVKTDYSAVA